MPTVKVFKKEYSFEKPHLRLAPQPGSYSTDARWSNSDLDPVPVFRRTWGSLDLINYWIADMLAPPLWSTIASVVGLGFTARQSIPITFFGFLIISFVLSATGRIAAIYHVPFPVLARTCFGMYGAIPAICIRSTVAMLWTAITIVQGGAYLENSVTACFPSYATFPNALPDSANITSGQLLMVFIYWMIQTSLAILPMHKMRYFFIVKSIVVPPTYFFLFLWAVIVTGGGGPLVTGSANVSIPGGYGWAVILALNVVVGLFSSLAVNMPDFGRFSKNTKSQYTQIWALPVIGTLGALAPIFTTSAGQQLYGEYIWYMPTLISMFDNQVARFFVGLSFAIATLGNNLAAGSYPFANDISSIGPRYINIFRASLIMAIFCVACTPWNIVKNGAALINFLNGYSCFMGPMAAILTCDFYIVRKQRYDIAEMYHGKGGIYWYRYGFNWRAWAAFFIAVAPCLPGLAVNINPNLSVPLGLQELFYMAWFFSFATAFVMYYIICKWISPPTDSLVAEAKYPPATLEEEKLAKEEMGGLKFAGVTPSSSGKAEAFITVNEPETGSV